MFMRLFLHFIRTDSKTFGVKRKVSIIEIFQNIFTYSYGTSIPYCRDELLIKIYFNFIINLNLNILTFIIIPLHAIPFIILQDRCYVKTHINDNPILLIKPSS